MYCKKVNLKKIRKAFFLSERKRITYVQICLIKQGLSDGLHAQS